jgi:hypothetical protein
VWQSESTGFYKQSLRKYIKGIRTIEVLCDDTMTKNEEMSIPEGLEAVPQGLWARDKYDVGLIKGCDPVKITPKK